MGQNVNQNSLITSQSKANGPKKTLLLGLLLLLTNLTGAAAVPINDSNYLYVESRIYNTSDSYIINWSEDGQEYTVTDGLNYGYRRVLNNSFWLTELDPHIAQIIRIIEVDENDQFITIGVTILENPNDPNPTADLPLRACVNNTEIMNARRFEEPTDWCSGDKEYYLDRIKFNEEYTIRFLSHPSYEWWLGEGQGGIGNGVLLCSAWYITDTIPSPSAGNISFKYNHSIKWTQNNPGCQVSIFIWATNQSFNWADHKRIPTNNDSEPLDCVGVDCDQSSPTLNTWYTREPRCDVEGYAYTRAQAYGYNPDAKLWSWQQRPIRTLLCDNYVAAEEEDPIWLQIFLIFILVTLWLVGFNLVRKKEDDDVKK